jgi:hypothetical protein
MNKLFLTVLVMMFSTIALAQPKFSSIEEQMTGNEYSATGMDKLSPEELAALNNWIRARSLATLDQVRPVANNSMDERGFENQKMSEMDRSTITTRLVGTFTGWDGETVFKLDNGMIWEQADKDKFYIKEIENPAITIEPGAFKTWKLSVEGYASDCRVERIQ